MPISGMARPVPLAAVHVRHDPGHVGPEGQDDQVEHGPPVFARLGLGHVALERGGQRRVDRRLRDVQPRFEPGRPLLHVAHGVEVLVELGPVVGPQVAAEGLGVVVDGVEDAPPPVQPGPPGGGPAGLFPEQAVEDVARVVLGRERDAVPGERQGGRVAGLPGARADGQFQRREPGVRPTDLGHQLVAGDGVLVLAGALGVDPRPGQPGVGADVGLAEPVGVVQPAEHGEVVAVLLQRLERRRQVVPAARLGDLPGHPVDAVGDVDEHAPARLLRAAGGGPQGGHGVQQRQRHGGARPAEETPAVEKPALREDVAHVKPSLRRPAPPFGPGSCRRRCDRDCSREPGPAAASRRDKRASDRFDVTGSDRPGPCDLAEFA